MPSLRGFIDPYGGSTCFLIPVFAERPGSNRILIQQIASTDTVLAFVEFDEEITHDYSGDPVEVKIGQKALWAFQFEYPAQILHGSSEEIIGPLKLALTNGALDNVAMTKTEVAHFCDDFNAFSSSVIASFKMLNLQSRISAEIWRDMTILLPIVKLELASTLPASLRADALKEVRTTGVNGKLIIEVPPRVLQIVLERNLASVLFKTKQLAAKFDLEEIGFSSKEEVNSPGTSAAPKTLPYGIVEGFSAIGALVVDQPPNSAKRSQIIAPPYMSSDDKRQLRASLPLFAFAVINPYAGQVVDAKLFASKWGNETIKVAIVMLPISFGTPRKDTVDVFRLADLHEVFDYVFIVGNHVLRKPGGVAPNLSAFRRGVTIAQACIRGFMQFAWTSSAKAKDIRKRVPRNGFALAGRFSFQGPLRKIVGIRQDSRRVVESLQKALDSMLNESIPFGAAKTLIAMGTAREFDPHQDLFDSEHVRRLLPRALRSVKQIITFQTAPRGSWHEVICLTFGIEPRRLNSQHFVAFCKDLIAICGWKISEWPRRGPLFMASNGSTELLVGCLVQLRDADDVIELAELQERSGTSFLTDCAHQLYRKPISCRVVRVEWNSDISLFTF